MPIEYRFTTVAQSEQGSESQWAAFVEDPRDDGSIAWLATNPNPGSGPSIKTPAPGVSIYPFIDDNGQYRWDIQLSGPAEAEDFLGYEDSGELVDANGDPLQILKTKTLDQFKVSGQSGQRLTERRRPLYDGAGNIIGDEVYASGTLETLRWRNILLIRGVDSLDSDYPGELREHGWL